MTKSYGGFILEVNLSRGSISKKPLPEKLCKAFIGGKGFGTKILYDHVDGNINPLSPDNLLILSIGPAAGTKVPFASRVNFSFKSPLTGCYAESLMGGYFAPKLKWAGIDIVIIKGAAEKPVYLYIDENGGELRDASHLWGKTTYETEAILKEELGKDAAVLEIGPAGERLVKFACICHANGWRQAGRAGPGAVMGSKKLKAIAVVSDRKEVEVADEKIINELVEEIMDHINRDPKGTLAKNYRMYGTPAMVETSNVLRFFPTRYWRKVFFEDYEKIGPKAMAKFLVRSSACWNCPFACGKYIEVNEGPYAPVKIEGPEYETIFAFGGLCEINDIAAIAKINDLCDMYGIDTITMGNVAGFAIEAYQMGKLKAERPLNYSSPEDVIWLIEKVVRREGIGDLLAEGVKRAAEKLGLGDLAVESRGLEPPGYDPRSLTGMALSYALSDRGACHLRATMYAFDISGVVDRYKITKEKVELYVDNEDRYNIFDCLVLCRFSRKVFDWGRLVRLVNGLTGFQYGKEDLKTVAWRIQTLTRLFNIRCGSGSEEDKVSPRFIKEAVEVEKGKYWKVEEKELREALKEYYRLRGWSESGIPTQDTLHKLGLVISK